MFGIKQQDTILIGIALVLAFAAPAIPTGILWLLDTLVMRILLVIALIYAAYLSPLVGIAALIAICMLYMERNRNKVVQARHKFEQLQEANDPAEMTVAEESLAQDTVPVREFREAQAGQSIYLPGAQVGNNEFQELDPEYSLNDKRALPTIPIGNKSAPLFKDYLA
jgi:hypothetical protein